MIYDFLVIGGGISGASAAYELAGDGTVLLLEAEDTMGYHSTGRSAALFTRNYGGPVVRQVNKASETFFRSPPITFCDRPLLSPRGALTVSTSGHEATMDTLLSMSEPGEEICLIDPQDAVAMVPFLRSERTSLAVYEANATDIDVASLHLGYLKGAKARGAKVMSAQSVIDLSYQSQVWRIETKDSQFSAATIINAAGAWADKIGAMAGARPIGLVPKLRTAIIINGPDGLDCSAMPLVDFANSGAYIKPEAGKLMASPGDAAPTNPHDAWADDMDIAVLVDRLEQETTIKVRKIEHSWAGLRSFVADETPVVGFDPDVPRFFWLAGQGGYGIMMAPALAAITAGLCYGHTAAVHDQLLESLSPYRLK